MTASASLSAPDDRDQSLLTATVSKPVSLLAEKPALEPIESVMDSSEIGDKLLPLDAPAAPWTNPRVRMPLDTAPQAEPEAAATAQRSAPQNFEKLAVALGIGHAKPPEPAAAPENEPQHSGEKVLAKTEEFDRYLKGNIDELETALKRFVRKSDYGFDHEVKGIAVQSYEILGATAEEYQLRVRYILRGYWLANGNAGEEVTQEDKLLWVRFGRQRIKILKSLEARLAQSAR